MALGHQSAWLQATAQTTDIYIYFGGNMGHKHLHRSRLQLNNEPRHVPSGHLHGLRWQHRQLTSAWSSLLLSLLLYVIALHASSFLSFHSFPHNLFITSVPVSCASGWGSLINKSFNVKLFQCLQYPKPEELVNSGCSP